jgi:hypothetical protein
VIVVEGDWPKRPLWFVRKGLSRLQDSMEEGGEQVGSLVLYKMSLERGCVSHTR